jgi:hypothetical protein
MNNLDLIVNFSEKMLDCRRVLQLDYLGEHFTREQCLMNKASACDNCSRVKQIGKIRRTNRIYNSKFSSVHRSKPQRCPSIRSEATKIQIYWAAD